MIITQIAGRLGRDPESRFTASGQKVTTLTVATNIRKGGKDETVWWRVTVWGDRFDKMIAFLKKGSAVVVVGEMSKPEIWTDKEGRPQIGMEMTAEILRFSPFGNPERPADQASAAARTNNNGAHSQSHQGGFAHETVFSDYGVQSSHGQGSSNQEHGEEDLPF